MLLSLVSIFIASLLGSPHCAGMCGGFVTFYASKSAKSNIAHVSYNLGRLTTYVTLGAIAGAIGNSLNNIAALSGISELSALIIGVLLVSWGLATLLNISLFTKAGKFITDRVLGPLHRWTASLGTPHLLPLILGLTSTLLPCGWLYANIGIAAGSGTALNGAITMLVFWLGTLPMMTFLGSLIGRISPKMLQFLPRVTAILILLAGAFSLNAHFSHNHAGHNHEHLTHDSHMH